MNNLEKFHQIETRDNLVSQARRLGEAAWMANGPRAPALNAECMALIKSLDHLETIAALRAFLRGWDRANLSDITYLEGGN